MAALGTQTGEISTARFLGGIVHFSGLINIPNLIINGRNGKER
jgi:hypothetical protein